MDFGSLTSFETGSVELLEFSWPPAAEDQTSQVCLAYVIMKRPSGFLLCVPDGFLSQTELEQGQQAGEEEGIGPSTGISAAPVQLSPSREWISPPDLDPVAALIVDLAAPLADQLSPADLSADDLLCFRPASPSVFPLASEVLRRAKEWLQAEGTMPADRSAYQTAASWPETLPAKWSLQLWTAWTRCCLRGQLLLTSPRLRLSRPCLTQSWVSPSLRPCSSQSRRT